METRKFVVITIETFAEVVGELSHSYPLICATVARKSHPNAIGCHLNHFWRASESTVPNPPMQTAGRSPSYSSIAGGNVLTAIDRPQRCPSIDEGNAAWERE